MYWFWNNKDNLFIKTTITNNQQIIFCAPPPISSFRRLFFHIFIFSYFVFLSILPILPIFQYFQDCPADITSAHPQLHRRWFCCCYFSNRQTKINPIRKDAVGLFLEMSVLFFFQSFNDEAIEYYYIIVSIIYLYIKYIINYYYVISNFKRLNQLADTHTI